MSTATETATWTEVCRLDDITPWCGVAALVGRRQIALLRFGDGDRVHALSNFDPFSQAMVISRGIVGDLKGEPVVASPVYKQHFRLADGICVEDPAVALAVFPVRVLDGRVEVAIPA